ncbi:MAG TPA: acyl-CoA dehydrogenase C-terminal domain-containing protein, partial [Lapillicoccus sp.]|nr:acyl-CoA dehydrogenase C-terminal domain-containing protein [Lapillicoccus sp.]
DLVVGWLLLREAEVAHEALTSRGDTISAKDRDFYTGKVAAARFFAQTILPRLSAERAIAEGTDASIMDVPESAF